MEESMFTSMAGGMNQPNTITKEALNLHRQLNTKSSGLGLSSMLEVAVCLHLSAEKSGFSVDVKVASRCAGAKSKTEYLNKLKNVKSILGLDSSLNLQEIGVLLNAPDLVSQAKIVLDVYEQHMKKSYHAERTKSINLAKSLNLCAAFYAAGKCNQHKLDTQRLVDLAKAKKKELTELGEEMFGLLPARKEMTKKITPLSETLLASVQEEPEANLKRKIMDEKVEHDEHTEDFQAWKRKILEKAVDAGFKQYKKYITPKTV